MRDPQLLHILTSYETDDKIGGVTKSWAVDYSITGYIDLLSGTDQTANANSAFLEESTHIAIITESSLKPTDKQRLQDVSGKLYEITYVDDPVGIGHHLELYLRYINNEEGE
jgi:hypothetical protein